jgi:hypothetical protein
MPKSTDLWEPHLESGREERRYGSHGEPLQTSCSRKSQSG